MADVALPPVPGDDLVEFFAAYILFAQQTATIVTAFLKQWQAEVGWRKPRSFPRMFLYELGAILRIAHWQQSPALAPLATEFAPAEELFAKLLQRFIDDPLDLCGEITVESCPLMVRAMQIWHRDCAWCGMEEVGCDIRLGSAPPRQLVALLADFFWNHRDLSMRNGTTQWLNDS